MFELFHCVSGETHLRSDDSRRTRWTHFTLETLEETVESEGLVLLQLNYYYHYSS